MAEDGMDSQSFEQILAGLEQIHGELHGDDEVEPQNLIPRQLSKIDSLLGNLQILQEGWAHLKHDTQSDNVSREEALVAFLHHHNETTIKNEKQNDRIVESTEMKVRRHLELISNDQLMQIPNIHIFNKLQASGEFDSDEDLFEVIQNVKVELRKNVTPKLFRSVTPTKLCNSVSKEEQPPVWTKKPDDTQVKASKPCEKVTEESHDEHGSIDKSHSYPSPTSVNRLNRFDSFVIPEDPVEITEVVHMAPKELLSSTFRFFNPSIVNPSSSLDDFIEDDKIISSLSFNKMDNSNKPLSYIDNILEQIDKPVSNFTSSSFEEDNYMFTLEHERIDEMDKILKIFDDEVDFIYSNPINNSKTSNVDIPKSIPISDLKISENFMGSFESEHRMKTYELPVSVNRLKAPDLQILSSPTSESRMIKITVPSAGNRSFECLTGVDQTISSLKLFVWIEVFQVQSLVLDGNLTNYMFRAELDDYFLDEKLSFKQTPYFIFCEKNNLPIELFFVSKMEIEEMNKQIESIIGFPLIISEEAIEFRKEMQQIVTQSMRHCYRRIRVAEQDSLFPGIENHLPNRFNVHIWFPDETKETREKKIILCDLVTTGQEAIYQIMEDFPYGFVGRSESSHDYILKIRGIEEYIMGDIPLISVEFIRNALRMRRKVEVVVLEKDYLDEDVLLFISNYEDSKKNRDNTLDIESLLTKSVDSSSYIATSWNVDMPLKVKIKCIDHIPFDTRLFKMPKKRNEIIEIFFTCYIVSSMDYKVGPVVKSIKQLYFEDSLEPMQFDTIKENIWMELAPLSNISLDSQIVFKVTAKLKEQETVIGQTKFPIFNSQKLLRLGSFKVACTTTEAISSEPFLTFEICPYDQIIAYSEHPFPKTSISKSADIDSPAPKTLSLLNAIIFSDSLYIPKKEERELVWSYREWARQHPDTISKVMLCIPWGQTGVIQEVYNLLDCWPQLSHPLNAITLLGKNFSDPKIRTFAVRALNCLSDEGIQEVLLQLVQSLKHEHCHDSSLARFLIVRALFNQTQIGHSFFWHLKANLHDINYRERYLVVMDIYLRHCSKFRLELFVQNEFYNNLITIAQDLKKLKDASKRKPFLHEQLENMKINSSRFQIPVNCNMVAKSFVIGKCKNLDSKTLPLWLVCENIDPLGEDLLVIMKVGDDLRQDQLTLQMIRIMDRLWLKEGLDLKMSPYQVIETGNECGMIEVIPYSATNASIQKDYGGIAAAFSDKPLSEWLKKYNPIESDYKSAVRDFVRSCAGYCVATYVLGIGDRHNDNIMCTKSGHLFHIDFGRFLGNTEKFAGMSRDRAPFVFTSEFAYVMGGVGSSQYKTFVNLCKEAYNVIRKHAHLFISLFAMMLQTGIPELRSEEDINYLRESFSLNLDDKEAAAKFEELIEKALDTKMTQLNFAVHILANPDKK